MKIEIEEKKILKVVLGALITYGILISGHATTEELQNSLEAWYKDSIALMKGREAARTPNEGVNPHEE